MNFAPVEKLLREGVESGVFPAACAGVVGPKGTKWVHAVGTAREETLFDLASLTKVLATTGIAARMVERKELSLDERVIERLADLPWHVDWSEVTVRDVLGHRAGFSAWSDLSKDFRDLQASPKPGSAVVREKILSQIATMPTFFPPRSSTIYSDLGFIIMGVLLETVAGETLDRMVEEEIRKPLGCSTLLARPLEAGTPASKIAATEDVPWRGGVIHGVVHDDNAYVLGGLAGHAGLFGTVEDCLKIGIAWRDSVVGKSDFLGKKVAEEFVKRVPTNHGFPRALGWDLPSAPASAAGTKASSRTIGHLGYTGTSIWIDLEREAVVVLLTNRVHPTSANEKIKGFRPRFHDAVWGVIDE
jgi:serine-type D-Ala-D-Ala carboxypeptidase